MERHDLVMSLGFILEEEVEAIGVHILLEIRLAE
jgi:hypothetical protein